MESRFKEEILTALLVLLFGLLIHFWQVGDREFFLFINNLHKPWLDDLMLPLTFLGDGLILAIFAIAIGAAKGWKKLVKVGFILIVVGVMIQIIKHLYPCPRPAALYSGLHTLGPVLRKYSFPSGHSGSAIAFATYLGKEVPRLKKMAWIVAILVAFSRVYIGCHFPGDVIFAGGLGYLIAILIY